MASIGKVSSGTIRSDRLKRGICWIMIKKWVYLLWTTSLIGGAVALIVGLIQEFIAGVDYEGERLVSLFLYVWAGVMYAVVALLGFFAFIILNYLMISTFKSSRLFQSVLWVLVIFVFADVVYLRYAYFATAEETWIQYVWFPLFILVVALFTAWRKSVVTHFRAFSSTVFFMFVFTVIELLPALKENNAKSLWFMLIPLLACNMWQIMQWHRLLPKTQKIRG